MDYKEKYNKLIEAIKVLKETNQSDNGIQNWVDNNVPELKELRDERIRKYLINYVKNAGVGHSLFDSVNTKEDILAWLEKQGHDGKKWIYEDVYIKEKEQLIQEGIDDVLENPQKYGLEKQGVHKIEPKFKVKYAVNEYNVLDVKDLAGVTFYGIEDEPNHIDYVNADNCEVISEYGIKESGSPFPTKTAVFSEQNPTDKVETKFHDDDWLINPRTSHIIHIKAVLIYDNKGIYELENSSMSIKNVEDNFRLWSIQDAKDGDVLITNKKQPFIFNGHYDEDTDYIYAYCGISDLVKDDSFYANEYEEEEFNVWCTSENVCPATKEQCTLLFQKMKEAGYEWDAEKKELKKVNSYCQKHCKGYQETRKCYADGECEAKKNAEIAWSEADDSMVEDIRNSFECHCDEMTEALQEQYNKFFDKVKSIKLQNIWKPSYEQMEALKCAIEDVAKFSKRCGLQVELENEPYYSALHSLYEQLKKFRE